MYIRKATREDFEEFIENLKRAEIDNDNFGGTSRYNFLDYNDFVEELKEWLSQNSKKQWCINTDFGIGITKV